MADLTEFLLARIAEDQFQAEGAAAYADERPDSGWNSTFRYEMDRGEITAGGRYVLAECEAKRRIVELAHRLNVVELATELLPGASVVRPTLAEQQLRALAVPYADHPDFDPSWRIEPNGDTSE